jgi:lysophospholipase L1-like esterase
MARSVVYPQHTMESSSLSELLSVVTGANDSTFPERAQHLSLEKYSENMRYYIKSILSPSSEYYQPHARVLLLTPPPISEKMREENKVALYPPEERTPADRSLENTRRYREEIIKIGEQWKEQNAGEVEADRLEVIDTWGLIMDASGGEEDDELLRPYFTDGLHLTNKAYGVVFDECLKVAKDKFEGLDPEDQVGLPMTVPQ